VARAVAGRARRVHAREEEELDHDRALALARAAAALRDVEGEAPRVVAARARELRAREERADGVEEARVGREVAARRAPDRPLVDDDEASDGLEVTLDAALRGRRGAREVGALVRLRGLRLVPEVCAHELDQRLAHEARLPGARDAGHGHERAERERDVEA